MYTMKRYCIYDAQTGTYYKRSHEWVSKFEKCKLFTNIGTAKSVVNMVPSWVDKCSIYSVDIRIGDKVWGGNE